MLYTLNLFMYHFTKGKASRAEMKSVVVSSRQRALGSMMVDMNSCHCGTGFVSIFMFANCCVNSNWS